MERFSVTPSLPRARTAAAVGALALAMLGCLAVMLAPGPAFDTAAYMAPVTRYAIPADEAVVAHEAGLLRYAVPSEVYTVDPEHTLTGAVITASASHVPGMDGGALAVFAAAEASKSPYVAERTRLVYTARCALDAADGKDCKVGELGFQSLATSAAAVASLDAGAREQALTWLTGESMWEDGAGFRPAPNRQATLRSVYAGLHLVALLDGFSKLSTERADALEVIVGFVLAQRDASVGGFCARASPKGVIALGNPDAVASIEATYLAMRILAAVAETAPDQVPSISSALLGDDGNGLALLQSFVVEAQRADGGFGKHPLTTLAEYIAEVSDLANTLRALVLVQLDIPAWAGNDMPPLAGAVLPRAHAFASACFSTQIGVCTDDLCEAFDFDSALLLTLLQPHAGWILEPLASSPQAFFTAAVGLVVAYIGMLFALYAPQLTGLPWHELAVHVGGVAAAGGVAYGACELAGWPIVGAAGAAVFLVLHCGASAKFLFSGRDETLATLVVINGLTHMALVLAMYAAFPLLIPQVYGLYFPALVYMMLAPLVTALVRVAVYPSAGGPVHADDPTSPTANTVAAFRGALMGAGPGLALQFVVVCVRPDLPALARLARIGGHLPNIMLLLPVLQMLGGAFFAVVAGRGLDMLVQHAKPKSE
ncbi:uncharacterized protein AMSG_06437 [Thecamonas trahens ATCC 50062]|uniref:Uncharacterized protein n=1 Tax=Thecamonas trahens ATCC 50062 TaxID=461836 RepID=A0A0L0DG09_THETB|nr:hypothetical protein AMSG_06437 [Thecamonas trahens ATCC 50062]KNC50278.1 hypothetical protein AMSG_06437 [Thecamonas trahens ATCC 50062]|eukprot:XP_013757105.1 hypothetical protein AMSG_06437 [Thecamonas trahens ATCC 50062]